MNNPNYQNQQIEIKEKLNTEPEHKLLTSKQVKTNNEEYKLKMKNLELSPDIKQTIIQEAFRMFDTDNSGEIDKKEFRKLVKSLGLELNNRKINELMRKYDENNSGQIDMNEFTNMMLQNCFKKDFLIELYLDNAFNLYDKNQDGFISSDDLMKVSSELEDSLGKEEAMLIVQLGKVLWKNSSNNVGQNQQGQSQIGIDKFEFCNMLEQLGFLQDTTENINKKEVNEINESNDKSNERDLSTDKILKNK